MHLTKIDLFSSVFNQYGVIDHFTLELAQAFNRQGVEARVLVVDKTNPRGFLNDLLTHSPDCTLSFNGLLPDNQGRFLCDFIHIPHVACLTDAPHHYLNLVKSPLNIITCVDKGFCQTFKDLNFHQTIFFPHAASRSIEPLSCKSKQYEVLMLNSFIDYESVYQSWLTHFPSPLVKVLQEAAERSLAEKELSYMQAFTETIDFHLKKGASIDPLKINYPLLLDALESYIGGKSRIKLLQSIEGVEVHVFGSQVKGKKGWAKYLKKSPHIHIHSAISFTEAIKKMKQTKILLNCTPEIKYGGHERLFNGLLAGAAVLSLETPYLKEQFEDEKDVLSFSLQNPENLNQKIRNYLENEDKRLELVERGRQKVLTQHTWDERAKMLKQTLPSFIQNKKFL